MYSSHTILSRSINIHAVFNQNSDDVCVAIHSSNKDGGLIISMSYGICSVFRQSVNYICMAIVCSDIDIKISDICFSCSARALITSVWPFAAATNTGDMPSLPRVLTSAPC